MLDPRLRIRHLSCFLETARLGSLSAAAAALHVSQPAASKTIKELEEILGTALFSRAGRRLTLTPAGKVFQQHAGTALTDLSRAQDLVRSGPREAARLAIGALPSASVHLLPSAALAFRAGFEDCLLRVSSGPNWLLLSQLREGALDMVVGRMASASVMEGLTFRQLYSEPVIAVVRPDHPALGNADPADVLPRYPLMLPPSGAVIAPVVRTFLARHGVDRPRIACESVNHDFGTAVTEASDVIWFISAGVVAGELGSGRLAALPFRDELMGGPVGVAMRDNSQPTPEQRGMLAALQSVARPPQNGSPM